MDPDTKQGRAGAFRDSSVLAAGSLVSGLAAYAFIAIGTRSVGPDAFAAVSVLWTLWAMSAAVFTFPVQHWVIRTIEADSGEGTVRAARSSLFIASIVVSLLLTLVCWLMRSTLFGDDGATFPILAGIVPLGTVFMGLNRGVLSARDRFNSTALAIAGENLIRAAVALIATTATGLGWSLVGGYLVGFFWPSSLRLEDSGERASDGSPLAFLGGVAGGSLIGQIVLTSGPLVLALVGGTPTEITGLFSALALFRAPYMVAIGVTPRITAWLTRIVLDDGRPAIWRITLRTALAGLILAVAAGALGGAIGPDLLTLVFGPEVILGDGTTAIVAAGSALAICTLFLTLLMLAAARTTLISAVWTFAAVAGIAVVMTGIGPPVHTVALGFLSAEIVALVAISLAAVNPRPRGRVRMP